LFSELKNKINNVCLKKIAVASLLAVVLFAFSLVAVSYLTDYTASARVTQGQIDRLRAEKRDYERRKRDVQSQINAIEFEHMAVMEKKVILDQRIMLTDLEIKNLNKIIEQLYQLISEKEYEVFLAQNREDSQFYKYRNRVRDMEENGLISYLEIVFDSTSFSDLLARIDFIRDIMRADRRLFDDLQTARNDTEDAKDDLEKSRDELEDEKEQLELKEIELLEQLDEAHDLIIRLEADHYMQSQLRDQFIAEEDRIQREINAAVELLRKQEEEEAERQRRLREQSQSQQGSGGGGSGGGGSSVSGKLGWPVPGGKIISRWGAPRGGRLHQGTDFGGAYGANVVAAESGTVITVSYGSGYGNYVTIAHGGGIQTLYSHLSSSAVSVGDSVSRGQVVGYVGSTGNATTPHLHFEVFVNRTRVNPELWL